MPGRQVGADRFRVALNRLDAHRDTGQFRQQRLALREVHGEYCVPATSSSWSREAWPCRQRRH